ncbi:hypothetical protein [Paenibacillus kribbensis]|uniref:hypothetical protein n=1 Tax=Paenibacillus kribbensis TaxID=172713 RepID=UPI0015C09735|nr:hypothetical protein [Paenibacillus kribbensis]
MIVERQGARLEDPSSLVISYIYKEEEFVTEVLPDGSDYVNAALELMHSIRLAITAVKVSQGGNVIWERSLMTRGSF